MRIDTNSLPEFPEISKCNQQHFFMPPFDTIGFQCQITWGKGFPTEMMHSKYHPGDYSNGNTFPRNPGCYPFGMDIAPAMDFPHPDLNQYTPDRYDPCIPAKTHEDPHQNPRMDQFKCSGLQTGYSHGTNRFNPYEYQKVAFKKPGPPPLIYVPRKVRQAMKFEKLNQSKINTNE